MGKGRRIKRILYSHRLHHNRTKQHRCKSAYFIKNEFQWQNLPINFAELKLVTDHAMSPMLDNSRFVTRKISFAFIKENEFLINLLADEGEMVDNSTQTPREDDNPKLEEEVEVQVEENNTGSLPETTVEEENEGDKSFNKLRRSKFSRNWRQRS